MFGTIISNQDSIQNAAKLVPNFKFVACPSAISEESLYILINEAYDKKNKSKIEEYLDIYKKEGYKKYLEIIIKYIDEL